MKLLLLVGISFVIFQQTKAQAWEMETKEFWLCKQETAKGLKVRSLRIHQFKENKRCLSLYSRLGKDQVIANGKWFGFCQKMLKQVRQKLENHLWNCEDFQLSTFFYSDKPLKKLKSSL